MLDRFTAQLRLSLNCDRYDHLLITLSASFFLTLHVFQIISSTDRPISVRRINEKPEIDNATIHGDGSVYLYSQRSEILFICVLNYHQYYCRFYSFFNLSGRQRAKENCGVKESIMERQVVTKRNTECQQTYNYVIPLERGGISRKYIYLSLLEKSLFLPKENALNSTFRLTFAQLVPFDRSILCENVRVREREEDCWKIKLKIVVKTSNCHRIVLDVIIERSIRPAFVRSLSRNRFIRPRSSRNETRANDRPRPRLAYPTEYPISSVLRLTN